MRIESYEARRKRDPGVRTRHDDIAEDQIETLACANAGQRLVGVLDRLDPIPEARQHRAADIADPLVVLDHQYALVPAGGRLSAVCWPLPASAESLVRGR